MVSQGTLLRDSVTPLIMSYVGSPGVHMERCIFTHNATPNLSELVINLRRMEAMLHASFEKEFPNQIVSYGYVLWAFSLSPPIAISIWGLSRFTALHVERFAFSVLNSYLLVIVYTEQLYRVL